MAKVELKGVHAVRSKGRLYYYAWRGGPRLEGEPGSIEFLRGYQGAWEGRKAPKDTASFTSLVIAYKASRDYQELADSTRRNWSPWLDRIATYFERLQIEHFNNLERMRPAIRKWRGKWADKPRTADYGMQVLSRVLAYGVDPMGVLNHNACEGIKRLYSSDRSEIIWTDADIEHLKKHATTEIGHAVDLAAHTGLRAGDLFRLSWSHVGEDAIEIKTGKSGEKRTAIVPLYGALRDILAQIPKCSPVVLTNSQGVPWKGGWAAMFEKAKTKAWPEGDNLHFHDLRGTAATKFYVAGLSERVIAEVMGWEEASVRKIIRRYVSRKAALQDSIRQLDAARKRT